MREATAKAFLASLALLFMAAGSLTAQERAGGEKIEVPRMPVSRVGPDRAGLDAEFQERLAEVVRKKLEKAKQPYDRPREALEFFIRKRAVPGERALPVERYLRATERMRSMRRYSSAQARTLSREDVRRIERAVAQAGAPLPALGTWQPLGPGNVGGRTRGLAIHPTSPNTMYAAGVSGGVWKTTNGGAAWTPIGDLLANIAVSVLIMDPGDPNVLYAGTGEGYFNGDAVQGAGIFKTTDGGVSWTRLPGTTTPHFHYVNDLVISPSDGNDLYAATRSGVLKSTDGGNSWTLKFTTVTSGFNGCLDLAIRGDSSLDVVFAACGNSTSDGIYRTTDGGATWPKVFSAVGAGRMALALAPSNQNVIYALVSNNTAEHRLLDVYRSTTGGGSGSWTARVNHAIKLNNQLLSNTILAHWSDCGFGDDVVLSQGDYDNVVAVDPLDANIVWAGGIDLFRSNDGGVNWGLASNWIADPGNTHLAHADQHAIVFHPGYNGAGNAQMFVGNDGGVFRTANARAATAAGNAAPCDPNGNGSVAWTDLNNGYAVTQFYHGLPYPDGSTYIGGTQDNGTVRGTSAAGPDAWSEILNSDGGFVAVHPSLTTRLYAEKIGISIHRSDNGGANWVDATSGIVEPFGSLFIVPFVMDPNNPAVLWTGAAYLWRTSNGATSWTRASDITPGTGFVSALAVAKGNSNAAVAGMSDGYIGRNSSALSAGAGTTWSFVQPAAGYVSSLAFDPSNSSTLYATYSTFGVGHVWKSLDGGASWANVDGFGSTGLPDIPAHSVVVDPSDPATLYVGTDLGVFVSRDRGHTWFVEQTGFANVVTESMSVNVVGGEAHIYAFTHGRGAWKVATGTATGGHAAPAITAPGTGGTIGVRGITFGWIPVGGAVNLYDLLVTDLATGNVAFSGSLTGASASQALITLESGSYQFKVRGCVNAVSSASCGSFSVSTFTVDLIEPAEAPTVSTPGPGQVFTSSTQTFSWDSVSPAPGGGDLRYEVLLEDLTGGTTDLQIATSGLSTIFSMHSSTEYRLRVRACQQACGPYSPGRTFAVSLPPIPSLAPVLATAVVTGNELSAAWTAVPNADLYQLQVIQPAGGPGGGALTVAARQVSTLSVASLPLPAGFANAIVRACNGDGCGLYSTPAGVDVAGPNPAAPNVATPIAGTVTAGPVIDLAWNRIAGDDGSNTAYRLFVQDLSRRAPALDVYTTQNFWSAFLKAEGGRYDAVVLAPGGVAGSVSGFNVAGASAAAPTMTTPTHDSQVTAGNVDLAWSPVPNAALYEYFVAVQGQPEATVRGVTQGLSVKVPLGVAGGPSTTYSAIARACPGAATCSPGGTMGWGPWSNAPGGPGVTNFTVIP